MKRLFPLILFLQAISVFPVMAVGSSSDEGKKASLADLLQKIHSVNDPDTARFFLRADQALELARKEGNQVAQMKCLRDKIIYETYHGFMERAQGSLLMLRELCEAKGGERFHNDFFDSWKNIAQAYYNNNSIMASMAEMQQMRKYSLEIRSDYGLACVAMSFGTFYANSYETSMKNLQQALVYLKKAKALEGNYNIYYSLAFTADINERYDEMLDYVEQMVLADPESPYVQQVADFMRLRGYVELGDRVRAEECYQRLKKLWDDYQIYGNLESNVVYSMVQYLCKFGNPNLVPELLDFISEGYDDLRYAAEVLYYQAKGNHRKALESLKQQKAVEDKQLAEQQRAEMANANAYYRNQQLEEEKQQILLDSAQNQNVLLLVIVVALIVIGASAVYIAIATRRYNSKLKIERDNVEEERKKAVYLSEMKTAFINNMSHEVRTPLNSIVGFNDLLNNPDFDFSEEERSEMLAGIHQQTEGLMDLLNNVIYLSRLDGHDIRPQLEDVRLADVCARAFEEATDGQKPQVPVDIQGTQDCGITLHTDRRLLGSAITSVLDNAIKFTRSGEIKVEITETTGGAAGLKLPGGCSAVRLTVTDTGDGIPADKAELVFERFEKLGRMEAGFGLGLSIARENLALIGGTIHLDTTYTSGSRMVIELPRT